MMLCLIHTSSSFVSLLGCQPGGFEIFRGRVRHWPPLLVVGISNCMKHVFHAWRASEAQTVYKREHLHILKNHICHTHWTSSNRLLTQDQMHCSRIFIILTYTKHDRNHVQIISIRKHKLQMNILCLLCFLLSFLCTAFTSVTVSAELSSVYTGTFLYCWYYVFNSIMLSDSWLHYFHIDDSAALSCYDNLN